MAKITTKPADVPAPAEVPVSTATAATIADDLVGHENASAAEVVAAVGAQAIDPSAVPAKGKRGGKRGPRADHGPTFPWSQPLYDALAVVAAGIVSGNVRGGLTLAALQAGFTDALNAGEVNLGDETIALEVTPEDLALLTPAEVKKGYHTLAKSLAKNDGIEAPELAVARRTKLDTSRLAGLFKPAAVNVAA